MRKLILVVMLFVVAVFVSAQETEYRVSEEQIAEWAVRFGEETALELAEAVPKMYTYAESVAESLDSTILYTYEEYLRFLNGSDVEITKLLNAFRFMKTYGIIGS